MSIMKAILLFLAILLVSSAVKAYAPPLTPSDSGIAVRVGDTITIQKVSIPPCLYGTSWDKFSASNIDHINFQYAIGGSGWCNAIFSPSTVGIHRDTVRFSIAYYAKGGKPCDWMTWVSDPIPLVYHAIPDTIIKVNPSDLQTLTLLYDERDHKYHFLAKCGLRFTNYVPDITTFSLQLHIDSNKTNKDMQMQIDSFPLNRITLDKNFGQYVVMTSFISEKMDPLPTDSIIPFKIICNITNSTLDSSVAIIGAFKFLKVDSGMAVVVGDTVSTDYVVAMPCPVASEDSVTYIHNDTTNFNYRFNYRIIVPTLNPKRIGLFRDTLHGAVRYPDSTECSGEPKRFGPVYLVYHGVEGTIYDIIPRILTTLDVDYDEATHRYSRGKRYALRFRSYFDKPTTFTCRILYDANIFPHQISPSFDSLMTSAFTLPANFGQFSVPMGITTDQMGPLLNDVSLKFTLVCNIKNSKFDTTILIQGGQLLFHHLDSGKAIPIGDIIVENDTLNLPFFIYSGDTVRFNNQDTENFGYVFLHDEGMVVANFTPHALGLFHDTLYIDYTDEFLSRQHSGPIPVVFHAIPASSSVTSSMKELFPTPTIKVYDSKLSITINVQEPSLITLSISDITGRTIDRIASDKIFQPGMHEIEYTPHSMSSGQYFLSYSTKDGVKVVPFSYIR
jgi:hypothetical protein